MDSGVIIRSAEDPDQLEIRQSGPDSGKGLNLKEIILNQCALVAESDGKIRGFAAIDLDQRQLFLFAPSATSLSEPAGRRLVTALEQTAVRFGILELKIRATTDTVNILNDCGYTETPGPVSANTAGSGVVYLKRAFRRRQTLYSRRIFSLLDHFGISRNYPITHRIPLQLETSRLKSIGQDVFDREQRMLPAAARAWIRMQAAAHSDGIEIQAVSAFRSVDYQAGIIQRKLDKGQTIDEILRVSAAPGFSEHHTGKAIDVTSPGYRALEEEFEQSPAFNWLTARAADFGFRLSFPRDNRHGVAFEPWHWAWNNGNQSRIA